MLLIPTTVKMENDGWHQVSINNNRNYTKFIQLVLPIYNNCQRYFYSYYWDIGSDILQFFTVWQLSVKLLHLSTVRHIRNLLIVTNQAKQYHISNIVYILKNICLAQMLILFNLTADTIIRISAISQLS